MREWFACVLHQHMQQIEFLWGKVDFRFAFEDLVLVGLQPDVSEFKSYMSIRIGCSGAPHRGADARRKLHQLERLCDVIVRSSFQRVHLVFFGVAYREHDDLQLRVKLPKTLACCQATHSGHV